MAEPDAEALDAGQGFLGQPLVVGEALQEGGREHHGAGAVIEGVSDARRRRGVDGGHFADDSHDPERVRGPRRGGRLLLEAAAGDAEVLVRRVRPHRHPAAHVKVAQAGGRVVDDRLVGAVEAGEAAVEEQRAVEGAEGAAVGSGEGVDGAELVAGLVG